ncbi:MAG: hypothetical protein Q9171_003966 [Xanthocarpia ochracea]
MVQRLAKGVLPPNTQIQKDAIVAMSKGATVFINHIADKANELTLSSNKKTITPLTVLEALSECEFEDFLPRVKAELDKFNEIATGKRNEYRRKIKEKEVGVGVGADGDNKNISTVNGSVNGGGTVVGGGGGMDERPADDDGEEGEGDRQLQSAGVTPEEEDDDEERYDTAMEDDGGGTDERESPDGEAVREGSEDAEDDEVDEEEEEEEEEASDDEDGHDTSQADMDNRLDVRQDGLSSGVEDDDDEESD